MKKIYCLFSFVLLLTSCEKTLKEPEVTTALTVSVHQLEMTPFSVVTRSSATEACTHLNFAIYDMEGSRQQQINQKLGDVDFGTCTFQLPKGTYQLVAVAHSASGNPTMTDPVKIKFTNAQGYTDTFIYYNTITIGDAAQTLALNLRRIVARCSFIINDAIPAGVARMRFQYKGGSGGFDAATGFGSINSTQTLFFDVQEGKTQTQFDLYTFPHTESATIHLQVNAYDAQDNVLAEREFDIQVRQNMISWYSGPFFTSGTSSASNQSLTATVTINTDWAGEMHDTY